MRKTSFPEGRVATGTNKPHNTPQVTATETATKKPQRYQRVERGIAHDTDPSHKKAPYLVTRHHDGKRIRSYHPTLTDARKALATSRKVAKREGTTAHRYDRRSHAEFEAAKELVGGTTSLVEVARFYADRKPTADEAEKIPTVAETIEDLIARKKAADRAVDTVADLVYHLGRFKRSFGELLVSHARRNDILEWVLALPGGARSKANAFAAVRSLFRFAERNDWVIIDPTRKIDVEADLPTVKKGKVGVLTVPQGHGLLRTIETHYPAYVHWACIKYFAGVRSAEADRFRGEWIDTAQHRIVIPGWALDDEGELQPGSKTRDDWVIDDVAPAFWAWMRRYPPPKGALPYARERTWFFIKKRLRALPDPAAFAKWPSNGWRHSFATYDLSLYRDQNKTALKLRHQNARRLWNNYLASLRPREEAAAYFCLLPLPPTSP